MKKGILLILLAFFISCTGYAQATLPFIGVNNYNGKIIVNWQNVYTKPIANISIQRSYDSLKNYTTIGSVLNPQSIENGYADNNPPYNKMYYRVFIAFEGGSYVISKVARPIKNQTGDSLAKVYYWQLDSRNATIVETPTVKTNGYTPSIRIFIAKENNVVIHLLDASVKDYAVIFYNDLQKKVFEIKAIKEELLIIEKVNFGRTGWFYFELYESGKLIEKNKFLISKDVKLNGNASR